MRKKRFQIYSVSKQAWEAMYTAIASAKKSIYWEMYIFIDDEAGNAFFDVLEKKAEEGVTVKVIVDYLGSFELSRRRVHSLKAKGVDIRFFYERYHRFRSFWYVLVSRTHRKLLIVDEQEAFLGGVNIQRSMRDWLDIHVRVRGRAVQKLLKTFAKMYIISGGAPRAVAHLLQSRRTQEGQEEFAILHQESNDQSSRIREAYERAFRQAKKRIILFTPYYFPDKRFIHSIRRAIQKKVRVELLVPYKTDIHLATYAGYSLFSRMRTYGVQIYFLRDMMHGKGVIVDDAWAMVGSSNLDHTSFYDNYETNVEIKNPRLVRRLKRIVSLWLHRAERFDDVEWKKRGKVQRCLEWGAYHIYHMWFIRQW